MKYEEFEDWIEKKCMYETLFEDSEGRSILVIRKLDAWAMCNKFPKEWVGLTNEEVKEISFANRPYVVDMVVALEARLKEKNT